jgi:hypothetical protein
MFATSIAQLLERFKGRFVVKRVCFTLSSYNTSLNLFACKRSYTIDGSHWSNFESVLDNPLGIPQPLPNSVFESTRHISNTSEPLPGERSSKCQTKSKSHRLSLGKSHLYILPVLPASIINRTKFKSGSLHRRQFHRQFRLYPKPHDRAALQPILTPCFQVHIERPNNLCKD